MKFQHENKLIKERHKDQKQKREERESVNFINSRCRKSVRIDVGKVEEEGVDYRRLASIERVLHTIQSVPGVFLVQSERELLSLGLHGLCLTAHTHLSARGNNGALFYKRMLFLINLKYSLHLLLVKVSSLGEKSRGRIQTEL